MAEQNAQREANARATADAGRNEMKQQSFQFRSRDLAASVYDIAVFSPDGKRILTASDDNTARLWPLSVDGLFPLFPSHYKPSIASVLRGS